MNGQLCKFPTATVTAIASTMYPVACRKGRGRSSLSTESVNRGGHPIQKCLLKVTIDEGHIINEFLISCPGNPLVTFNVPLTKNKKCTNYLQLSPPGAENRVEEFIKIWDADLRLLTHFHRSASPENRPTVGARAASLQPRALHTRHSLALTCLAVQLHNCRPLQSPL